jgi:Lsr2
MTTRMQFITTDDLDENEKDELNDIGDDGETIVFSVDGRVRELHLTAAHAKEFRGVMQRYLAAGHEPGQQPLPPAGDRPPPRKGQGRRREIPGTRDFYRGLREWAGRNGREVPMAGRSDAKKNYVYDKLTGPYLDWLRAEAEAGRDGGVAAAQLAMAGQLGLVTGVPAGTRSAPG